MIGYVVGTSAMGAIHGRDGHQANRMIEAVYRSARENRVVSTQFVKFPRGEDLPGLEIAFTPNVVVGVVQLEVKLGGSDIEHLHGLTDHFGPGSVSTNHGNVIAFHRNKMAFCYPTLLRGIGDANDFPSAGNGIQE